MRISKINIENFRGIKRSSILLPIHTVFVGDNNSGKSTILEAVDLVLGPERLSRFPVLDEHDFYSGIYLDNLKRIVSINIQVILVDLTDEQKRHFREHIQWWDNVNFKILEGPPANRTDNESICAALAVGFTGYYDSEEDNFVGKTHYLSPLNDGGELEIFRSSDKRQCGFLYLRTLRTGTKALSLERGSLLDIILKLKNKKLLLWEDILKNLYQISVAEDPKIGMTDILVQVQDSIRSLVPMDWADKPQIKITDLTRESLRKVLTVFIATGSKKEDGTFYSAPFQHQGTGTINTLVLSLLTIIADLKQNVIFAMEEPEIAVPPHTQKRIVNKLRNLSSQCLFTSHSPYVLEEFEANELVVLKREEGILSGQLASIPPKIKVKAYKEEFRRRFCESLLAKRILLTEGFTELHSFIAVANKLHILDENKYSSLEALGIAVINAGGDQHIKPLGEYFLKLGKIVFAVFDKQLLEVSQDLSNTIVNSYEAPEKGFENVILNGSCEIAIKRYALSLVVSNEWPMHLTHIEPNDEMTISQIKKSLLEFLKNGKSEGLCADFLEQCTIEEMPKYIVETINSIKNVVENVRSY